MTRLSSSLATIVPLGALLLLASLVWPLQPAIAQGPAQQRTWTDSSGTYTVEASMIALEGDKVTLLRADGRKVVVPLDKLSKADQDFVRTAAGAPAVGQPAGPNKLPFDAALVSDDFQAAVLARPGRILKSEIVQSLMKLAPVPSETKAAGVDLAEIDWVIVLVAPTGEPGAAGTDNTFSAPDDGAAPAAPAAKVGVIVVSQKPFDRDAIKASAEFQGATESMVDGKVQWTVATPAGDATDFLFYSDNVLLASAHGMVSKMLAAKGSGQKMLGALQQAELEHDLAVVSLSLSDLPQAGAGADGQDGSNPFNRIARNMEYGTIYLDLGNALKFSAKVAAADAQQAQQLKQQADAGMGFVKLMATLGLQEQLKDLEVDTAPLTSLVDDTLNSFQSSVDGNAASFSIATPADTAQRVEKCMPIVQAIMLKQLQAGGEGGANPFGPGGGAPNPGGTPFGPGNGSPFQQP